MGNNLEQLSMRMRAAIGSGEYNDAFDGAAPASMPVEGDRMSTPAASSGGGGGATIKGSNGRELPAFVGTGPGAAVADGVNKWATGDLSFLEGKMGQR